MLPRWQPEPLRWHRSGGLGYPQLDPFFGACFMIWLGSFNKIDDSMLFGGLDLSCWVGGTYSSTTAACHLSRFAFHIDRPTIQGAKPASGQDVPLVTFSWIGIPQIFQKDVHIDFCSTNPKLNPNQLSTSKRKTNNQKRKAWSTTPFLMLQPFYGGNLDRLSQQYSSYC